MKKIVCLIICLFTAAVQASVIYDNGGPNTQNGYSVKGSNQVNDNFNLTGFFDVKSVGFYFQNYNGITGWNKDIIYNFYADNGGNVGSLLASGSGQNLTATDSGLAWCCGGGNAWLVKFDLVQTLSLASGTYWLGLTGATGSASSAWWVTADSIDGSSMGGVDFAFYIDGQNASTVSAPASIALLGLGLALVGFSRRKKTV
ncbi:MAG: PEP-CTERM sorting domain-containing protein [Gammaproteobacteria bacterium]|jgi:hypothetical protein|nr:PEP-CTERM sorting domain-containing protein [Gammaproteobacteria bacterium]